MLTLLLLLGGCDGSGLEWKDTFDPDRVVDPVPTTDTDITTVPGAEDCIWVGTWEVVQASCGDAGFSDWRTIYDSAILAISHNREAGCDMVLTLANETCIEEATFWGDPEADSTTLDIKDNTKDDRAFGVTACDPESCKFTNGDVACSIGDHQSPQTVLVDQSVADTLSFTFFAAYAAPTCDDALRLVLAKQ